MNDERWDYINPVPPGGITMFQHLLATRGFNMTKDAVFISGNDGWVVPVTPNSAAVIYAPAGTSLTEALTDPADNPRMSVADLYDQLTWTDPGEEAGPDFDLVESLGFDGTGREEPTGRVTWEQVARRLLEQRGKTPRVHLTSELIERFAELETEVDSPDSDMWGAVITVNGVELQVGEMVD